MFAAWGEFGQWRNRRGWGGGGAAECPPTLLMGNFCWPARKREARKKGKMEKKRRKIKKKEGGKLKMEEENYKMSKGPFFFFFFFFFCFSLFKTTEIWNLFWVYQNGNFLPGKSISRREKNLEKWLCPLWKIFPICPWVWSKLLHIGT